MVRAAGDAVKPGENLFEIETDKVSMEVPAIAAGTLAAIHVQAGEIAPVGAVVAVIQGKGEAVSLTKPQAARSPAAHARESGDPEPEKKELDSRLRGNERSVRTAAPRRRKWSRSARCARPSATTARRGLPAAPSSRRWRAGSRVKRESISPTSKAPARTAASWRPTSRRRARPAARAAQAAASHRAHGGHRARAGARAVRRAQRQSSSPT